jgi:hypothetical protein
MLKRIILAFFTIWIIYAVGNLSVIYFRIYHSHKEAEVQLNKQLAEQERIDKLTVQEILKEVPPKYGVKVAVAESVTKCESTHNPKAINYHDGGYGKHSVGLWQYQSSTWNYWSKKYGEKLDINSAYDQTKLASYMLSKNQGHQWTCYRKIYNV